MVGNYFVVPVPSVQSHATPGDNNGCDTVRPKDEWADARLDAEDTH
jgi:hypothetical protein